MNKTDPHVSILVSPLRRAIWLAAVVAGCCAGMPAAAQSPAAGHAAPAGDVFSGHHAARATADDAWAEGDTVRELLRADAQAARAAQPPRLAADWLAPATGTAHTPGASTGNPPDGGPGSTDRIDVVAIYGVGKALHADISVNGHLSRYRAGHAKPMASHPSIGESYALLDIQVPCVRLRKSGEPYITCLLDAGSNHD
ncbi:MAG TPA: hypothetical protein VEA17_07555 [Bordetella sp.]|nr:hypothetical protein [Bordetella sp.]